jgi:septum formation protein
MLDSAGVRYEAIPADLDESAIKSELDRPEDVARELAEAKALSVSRDRPADLVIGSDSVVTVGGRMFDKPTGRGQAEEHLRLFSGEEMRLTSAVALARNGQVEWRQADTAILEVRPLSDSFIRAYLDAEWPQVGYCVGVFRLEGRGVQLFDRIHGDYFTILGMPLIPLLGALRERQVLPA